MSFQLTKLYEDRMLEDALPATELLAQEIAGIANRRTSAPAGITTERREDHVLIGPTGAAGLPVEIGTIFLPAKRYFKRSIDPLRIK
jgi:hypothetical protein